MDGIQSAVLEHSSITFVPLAPVPGGRISPRVFVGVVGAADLVLLLIAGAAMRLVHAATSDGPAGRWQGATVIAAILAAMIAGWGLRRMNAYSLPRLRSIRAQLAALPLSLLAGSVVAALCLLLLDRGADAAPAALAWLAAASGLLAADRLLLARLLADPRMSQRLSRRIVVFGANQVSHRFITRLHADRASTDRVLAVFDDRRSRVPDYHAGVPVLGRLDDLLMHCRREPIDAIVLALPLSATARVGEVFSFIRPTVSDIYVTADVAGERLEPTEIGNLGPNPVVAISRQPLDDWAMVQKRALDLVAGIALLVLVAPVMGLIALAIRIDSEGPALFRQTRRGFNNTDFVVFKFRTMHHHLGDVGGGRQTVRNDPRVTRVGRLLRRLSFDELPQLLNVLRGDMSLVGPRPHALSTRAGDLPLEEAVSDYTMRHRVKPGITGWAQVNGFRGAIRSERQLRSRVEYDLYYINHWSLWFDIKIMFMTLNAKRHQRNAF